MGFLKKLFTGISVLIVAVCAMVLLCALNPGMTQSFSAMLYGTENMDGILSGFLNREEEEDLAETGTRADQVPSQPVTANVTPLAYEVTQESITTLPENVYGRSGYAPIQSSAESVSSAEASRLKTEIGYGPTGSDLQFDEEYYPYFAMLSDNQKSVYKQIYANARAMNASFASSTDGAATTS